VRPVTSSAPPLLPQLPFLGLSLWHVPSLPLPVTVPLPVIQLPPAPSLPPSAAREASPPPPLLSRLRSDSGTCPRSRLLQKPLCRHCGCKQIRYTPPRQSTEIQEPLLMCPACEGRHIRAVMHGRRRPDAVCHRNLSSLAVWLIIVSAPLGCPCVRSSW
jgi:hypothetical protein